MQPYKYKYIERADLHGTNIHSFELILVSQIFSNGAEF